MHKEIPVSGRLKRARWTRRLSSHSFRVTIITDLLAQGIPLEAVHLHAGHSDPRTTRLDDRSKRPVIRNVAERTSI
ncbi:MAG: tyrosine-type recombinase/integrase [Planctomycetes bacterium]|nr:tyrosine-type recombinase/integrase [Planctomycetota bacterium]